MNTARLTIPKILTLKPAERAYLISEGSRPYLWIIVWPTGKKSWQYRYQFGGKRKVYSIGQFPAVSLNNAQATADRAAIDLKDGRDPMRSKSVEKAQEKKATFTVAFFIILAAIMLK